MAPPGRPRGRGVLLALRVAAAAASLLFAVLFLTTVLMVAPGSLEFTAPGEEIRLRFEEGILYVDTTFSVRNQGYHDLTNLVLHVRAAVEDAGVVTEYATDPVDVPVGQRRPVNVSIPLDLAPLTSTGALIFRPANVTFTMGLSGTTTRSLLDFAGSFTDTREIGALVPVFDVDFASSNLTSDGTNATWTVPYVVGTASFLQGHEATAAVAVFNESGDLLTETEETVPLGTTVEGNLTFPLDQAAFEELATTAQTLTVVVELSLPGDLTFPFEEQVEWDPEGGG